MNYADLELGVHRRDSDTYTIEMRFTHPDSEADVRLTRGTPAQVTFNMDRLFELALRPDDYGTYLSECLFADATVKSAFLQATSAAQSLDVPLRVRLLVGSSATELHSLRWETLRAPDSNDLLLTNERVLFSRYLSSLDWRPVRLRPKAQMRALVVVANPADLTDYSPAGQDLYPFDVDEELARAARGLGDIPITALTQRGTVSLHGVAEQLRAGYDILYMVVHGALIRGEPRLWMENEDGTAAVVAGSDLVTRLRELPERPRLIVLASCQSGGTGANQLDSSAALTSLGPRLAEAGSPAVIAMQGNISVSTLEAFTPVFFTELQRDGQIDRALAVARGAIRTAPDWWMPVLYMRLRSGRIWYVPGFGQDGQDFRKWPALLRNIARGNCTPIIGPRLTETLLGSSDDIARRWAETYGFPLAPHQTDDLPQVAQYLAVNQQAQFPREELLEHLRNTLVSQYADRIDQPRNATAVPLEDLFALVGSLRRNENPADPYRVLAELPFRVYITTNLSNLLTEALRAAGKDPQVELCRWHEDLERLPSIYHAEPDFQPTFERPLVYHLFGHSAEPDSLVVTEDDYFDYLIGVTSNKDLIPIVVRQALADTGLLFLGFEMDDWSFRILFRSIMSQEGRGRRKRYAHVAAQITPDEGRILEPQRARQYLERYFQDADIDIYWGTVDDFVRELVERDNEPTHRARKGVR